MPRSCCLPTAPKRNRKTLSSSSWALEPDCSPGYFLDSFRAICEREHQDYYDRLTYVVTDGSQATIEHWRERDVFAAHPGRVVMQVCDAARLFPDRATPVQAIFCNYILDVLPTAIVRRGAGGTVEQLCLRTHLNDDPGLLKLYVRPRWTSYKRSLEC